MLNSYLNNESYINLGMFGASYQQIVLNCLVYIEKYGPPKNLFILFPNIERQIFYDYKPFYKKKKLNKVKVLKEKKSLPNYYNWPLLPTSEYYKRSLNNNSTFPKEYRNDHFSYKTLLFGFYQEIKIFELLMQEYKINFHWTTTSYIDKNNFKLINKFNNFIYYGDDELHNHIEKYTKNNKNKKNLILKEDGHLGVAAHDFWKNLFLEKVLL